MNLARSAVVGAGVSCISAAGLIMAGSDVADAAVRGVSIQSYCASTYAGAYGKAVTVGSNAYSWRCQVRWNGNVKNLDIDMNDVCKKQYSTSSRAYLVNNDSSSLYNWRCS